MGKKKLTMKNTKSEMIKAYNELLAKYEEKAASIPDKKAEVKREKEKAVVEKASTYTVENIVKGLADLKLSLSKALTDLSDQLTSEANKLGEIREAIAIEKGNLEEVHDIKVAANSLSALIEAQEERKERFEAEMKKSEEELNAEIELKRAQWKKEQEEHNLAVKERDANLKKDREREEEEYAYNLRQTRKREKDAYEEEKAALKKALKEEREAQERDLGEREAAVAAKEAEIAELTAKVEAFPSELSKAIKEAEKAATVQAENKAKQEIQLLKKEFEGDRRASELTIKSLEETVEKQAARIESLNRQLSDSTKQVQNIAVKAIEGASGVKALQAVNEIALEQARKIGLKE